MKRISLAIIFACCTLALAAQETIRVNYQGSKPTISDFAWAFLSNAVIEDEDGMFDESTNAVKEAWILHRKGLPQSENMTLTIDQKNGYAVLESRQGEHLGRWEMCYWNEADGKHKLFAYNVAWFKNGKYSPGQYDGIIFYRYNNATKTMTSCDDTGVDVMFHSEDGVMGSYALPRVGKDIIVTLWYDNGKTKQKTLKWNGRRFTL